MSTVKKYLSIFYSVLLAIYPFLSMYQFFIKRLSVADVCLMILVVTQIVISIIEIVKNGFKNFCDDFFDNTANCFWVFFIYIFISSLLQLILGTKISILSTVRYLLFLFALIAFIKEFNFDLAVKTIRWVSILVSIYVIIQYIYFKAANDTLPWKIPFLPVIDESFILKENDPWFLEFYRPTGIFYEPTHFSQYCLTYLPIAMFARGNKIRIFDILIISIAIFCSGSSAGLLCLAFCYLLLFVHFFMQKQYRTMSLITFSGIAFIAVCILQIPYFKTIISRMLGPDGSLNGPAIQYRFGYIAELFDGSRSAVEKIFGTGRGSELHYYTSLFYVINAHGFIGGIIFIGIYVYLFIKCKSRYQRMYILMISFLSIGSEILCNFGIMIYFSYILGYKGYYDYDKPVSVLREAIA